MKRFFALIVLSISIFSCGDDVQFNNPAFQGIKDGNILWKATAYTVTIDDNGFLAFAGSSDIGALTLQIPSVAVGTYTLGNVTSMSAIFEDTNSEIFSTSNIGDRGPFHFSDGQIVISEINTTTNTISGTFRFNAFNRDGDASTNFIEGVIYQLPITSGTIPTTVTTCSDTEIATQAALVAYQAADPNDIVAFATACNAYRNALENQRTYCGDPQNELQQLIDDLGDCIPN